MNSLNMDATCLRALRRRGRTDAQIAEMTPEEAFCEYCAHLGILNLTPATVHMLDRLRNPEPVRVF